MNVLKVFRINFSSNMLKTCLLAFFVIISAGIQSAYASGESESGDDAFNPGEMILHHVKDDYSWEFWHGKFGTLYLPVILYTEDGVKMFSSSNFYDEHHHLQTYKGYELDHGSVHATAEGSPIKFDFSITKNVFTMFIVAILMLVIFFLVAKAYKKRVGQAPKGLQSFMEPIILFVRDDIAIPNLGESYKKYMPFLLTVFFFIWIGNLLGLLPGASNLTGNIAVTATLALFTFIITMFSTKGYYWRHIISPPGVPFLIKLILVPVEIIGIFTKPFSLMIRLFANITAGHVVLLSLISLTFILQSIAVGIGATIFSVFMMCIELLVAALQAYIFTLLSAIYFSQALDDGHH